MKRAAPVSAERSEMVPNYWLRSLATSPHLSPPDLAAALKSAGLAPEVLDIPGTMIPLGDEISVLDFLAQHSDDPLLPLRLGLSSRANTGSILSYILFASPTLDAALSNMCEFVRLTRPRSRIELVSGPGTIEFRMSHPEPTVQRAIFYREFVLGNILHSFSAATQTTLKPECIAIAVPIGKRAQKISALLGCRVEDAKGHSGIVLKSSCLDLPIRSSDEHLLQHLTEYGRMLLSQMRPEALSTRERVFRYLLREVPLGVPRVSDAAKALALSERTLARRLAEEGTSYRDLVDQTRATMADALLDDPSVSLTEISYLLGFSDPSSFSAAYRRWTGRAPIAVRRDRAAHA